MTILHYSVLIKNLVFLLYCWKMYIIEIHSAWWDAISDHIVLKQ